MQESSVLIKEVSSCRRAQHCSKRSAHSGELSTAQIGQLSSAQEVKSTLHKRSGQLCTRGQLIQESSALTKEVSSALRKRSGQLYTRGQLGQKSLALPQEVSSAIAHPLSKKVIT